MVDCQISALFVGFVYGGVGVNRLIFIEGISGVGKSTSAALLCDELQKMGFDNACYVEGDRNNPLDPFKGTYPPAIPLKMFQVLCKSLKIDYETTLKVLCNTKCNTIYKKPHNKGVYNYFTKGYKPFANGIKRNAPFTAAAAGRIYKGALSFLAKL